VKLPPDDAIQGVASRDLLAELVQANVTGMNCPDFMLTDGEWTLITGTADKVAAVLGIDTNAYDADFYGPAFASLDKAGTCAAEGPKIRPLIDRLIGMGGGTEAVN
jgi:hypothetical protein